jgi:hypothetical protein
MIPYIVASSLPMSGNVTLAREVNITDMLLHRSKICPEGRLAAPAILLLPLRLRPQRLHLVPPGFCVVCHLVLCARHGRGAALYSYGICTANKTNVHHKAQTERCNLAGVLADLDRGTTTNL